MRGHGEGEAHIHSATVAFHWGIKKALDLRECHDFVKLAAHLGTGHAKDRTIEEDVLSSSQLRVETRAHLQQ